MGFWRWKLLYFTNPTHTYSSAGTYNVSLTVTDGASTDSETKTAFITVGSTVNTQENITACDNYSWNGTTYYISGNYIDTLQTSLGCDSIVTLVLTLNISSSSQENITSCNNYTGMGMDTLQTLILNHRKNIISCNNYTWNGHASNSKLSN